MYVMIDDKDLGEVHDSVCVVIGEGSHEVRVSITRLSVVIEQRGTSNRIELDDGCDEGES